jgi:hypothetical protein
VVLALGLFFILIGRPPLRIAWVAGSVLILAVATGVESSVTILALQAAIPGMILTILAVIIERMVPRQRHAVSVFGDPNHLLVPPSPGSTLVRGTEVGSDDSTAIRVRPASTLDHVPMSQPTSAEGATRRESSLENA